MVSFQWDPRKARANLAKHGIDFADAVGVFDDPHASTLDDDHRGEQRYVTAGRDLLGRVVVVVWTPREDEFRLISARSANPRERRQYEEDV
jgi:hypothetical protein